MTRASNHMNLAKWPKVMPPLTAEQQRISDDFMKHWHEVLPRKFGMVDRFGHNYVVKHAPTRYRTTLEIGAGLGEHLAYERLTPEQEREYVALELRENMAEQIRVRFPRVHSAIGDCQTRLAFPGGSFDRILAIHVLEHLPNLPEAVREMHRLCNPDEGRVFVVIPCEGSAAYSLARRISAQRIFERRYKQPYDWLIKREHLNRPHEIIGELEPYFAIVHRQFFPLPLPFLFCNLCLGLTLKRREDA